MSQLATSVLEQIRPLDETVQFAMPQSAAAQVAVVVVNYHCLAFTLQCLASLAELEYPNFIVIVIDNGSTDQSGEELLRRFPNQEVKVVISPENLGFAGGNNLGIRYAREYGAEYVWLVNADTKIDSHALTALVEEAKKHPEGGAFGSKILYDGVPAKVAERGGRQDVSVIWGAGGKIDPRTQTIAMTGWHEVDNEQYNSLRTCDYLPGCSLFFPLSTVDKVGGLPEEYFMYFEETEWCTWITAAGLKLYYIPGSIVWHCFDDDKMSKAFGVYYYNRNNLLFWFRRLSFFKRIQLVADVVFRRLPRIRAALRAATEEEQKAIFRAHWWSHVHFLLGRFGKQRF